MRTYLIVSLLLLSSAACGSSSGTKAPATTPLPEQGVTFATSNEAEVTLWRATPGGVVKDGAVTAPANVYDLAWLDAKTAIVLLETQQLGRISDGRFEALPAIPDSAWQTPKPTSQDPGNDVQPATDYGHVYVVHGALWVMRCVWDYGNDEMGCDTVRWVRVLPSLLAQEKAPDLGDVAEPPRGVSVPGQRLTVVDVPGGESGDGGKSVSCGGATVPLQSNDDAFPMMYSVSDPHWVRASPPRFAAIASVPGMDEHDQMVMVEGCPPVRATTINEDRIGPHGVWAWSNDAGWHVEGLPVDPATITATFLAFAP